MHFERLAFDRGSVRYVDDNGHLHVKLTNISKAMVCPYYGREIPDADKLGLNPDTIYQLLRDPDELRKSAASFDRQPLMFKHTVVGADDPQPEVRAGTLGSDCQYSAPYLKNSIAVWDAVAIALINSEDQKELSAAYRYDADMTPGVYEGVAYDGVMRNIRGNHVALVEVGRAGPDVVVADSKPKEMTTMPKVSRKAIAVRAAMREFLRPVLATDTALGTTLNHLVKDVTAKNFKDKVPALAAGVKLLAKDADPSAVADMLHALAGAGGTDELGEDEDEDAMPAADEEDADKAAKDAADMTALKAHLKGKLSDDDYAAACGMMGGQGEAAEDEVMEGGAKTATAPTKAAMDAAIKAGEDAAVARMSAVRTAENEVRPLIGDIAVQQTADAVYKLALDAAKVDLTDVPPAAYRPLVKRLLVEKSTAASPRPTLASDAGIDAELAAKYPHLANVRSIG